MRRGSPALRRGDIALLDAPAAVLAFRRSAHGDERVVLVNFGETEVDVHLDGRWTLVVSSDPAVDRWDGGLRPSEAVVLQLSAAQGDVRR